MKAKPTIHGLTVKLNEAEIRLRAAGKIKRDLEQQIGRLSEAVKVLQKAVHELSCARLAIAMGLPGHYHATDYGSIKPEQVPFILDDLLIMRRCFSEIVAENKILKRQLHDSSLAAKSSNLRQMRVSNR